MALGTPVIGATSTFVAAATSLTVPYPTIVGRGVLVLFVGTHPETITITTPTGWTAPTNGVGSGGAGTFGSGTGPVQTAAFWTPAADQSGNLTVTVSTATSSAVLGRILFIPSSTRTFDVAAANGVDSVTGTAWSVTFGSNPGTTAGDIILTALTFPTSTLPTFASSALASTGAAFTENFLANWTSSVGNTAAGRVEYWTLTGTGSTAPVHTITLSGTTTNDAGAEVLVRVRQMSDPTTRAMSQALNRSTVF